MAGKKVIHAMGANPDAVRALDLDGDGDAGGSVSDLAWKCAEVAWAACHAWAEKHEGVPTEPWAKVGKHAKLVLAIDAQRCIDDPAYVLTGFCGPWESTVRGPMFAAVVRVIAL